MRKILCIALLCLTIATQSFASLEVYFMYTKFNSPQGQYIETYMSTIGSSTVLTQKDNGKFQSEIEVVMVFKVGDSIVNFDKYVLRSPEIADTTGAIPNFIDVQRITLPNGTYTFDISIRDVNSEKPPYCFSDKIEINFTDALVFSDIELIESYKKSSAESSITKSGYDLVPYVANFFPENMNSLKFYIEAYNTDKALNDDFMLKYHIDDHSTGKEIPSCSRFKKMKPSNVVPFIGELGIEKLPSGNYDLVVEIANRNNEIVASSKYFFQRQNKAEFSNEEYAARAEQFDLNNTFAGDMNSRDSLIYYIRAMRPIASVYERPFIDNQLRTVDLKTLQKYFVEFWVKRNYVNPENEWYQYKKQIEMVEKNYATTIRHGFETDRGVIYLQYGMPNHIFQSPIEPGAYPYEIWQYYRLGEDNNCKFVFYNPSMEGREFELLHSNKQGEIHTFNWTRYLSRSKSSSYGISDTYNSVDFTSTGYGHNTFDNDWERRAIEEFNK